jgi:hypothetical protein
MLQFAQKPCSEATNYRSVINFFKKNIPRIRRGCGGTLFYFSAEVDFFILD